MFLLTLSTIITLSSFLAWFLFYRLLIDRLPHHFHTSPRNPDSLSGPTLDDSVWERDPLLSLDLDLHSFHLFLHFIFFLLHFLSFCFSFSFLIIIKYISRRRSPPLSPFIFFFLYLNFNFVESRSAWMKNPPLSRRTA